VNGRTDKGTDPRTAGKPDNLMLPAPVGGEGITNSSAMAERPRVLGDFKGVGQFEAKF